MITSIHISENYVREIIMISGYPLINFEDKDFEMNKDDFKQLIVLPTMREYYRWFPRREYYSIDVSSNFSVPFPDNYTFDALDARINTSTGTSPRRTANACVNARNYSQKTFSGGYYGTPYDYHISTSYIYENQAYQSTINYAKNTRVVVDREERVVTGYSNMASKLNITWAKFGDDFDKIPYTRIGEVIKLCQANWLEWLYLLRGQQNSNLPVEWNYDLFQEISDKYREEVMNVWRKFTKVAVIKN